MQPGQLFLKEEDILCNVGRDKISLGNTTNAEEEITCVNGFAIMANKFIFQHLLSLNVALDGYISLLLDSVHKVLRHPHA